MATKKINFTIEVDDNSRENDIINDVMNDLHNTFKGTPDYVDSKIVVSTDTPYDGEYFKGDEANVYVDLTHASNKATCLLRVHKAFTDAISILYDLSEGGNK